LQFKNVYLPELKGLNDDCQWLRSKLGLDSKKNMAPNEVRLVQFSVLVDAAISQINKYKISSGVRDNGAMLRALETKIVNEILPVKSKLRERLKSARIASAQISAANNPPAKKQNVGLNRIQGEEGGMWAQKPVGNGAKGNFAFAPIGGNGVSEANAGGIGGNFEWDTSEGAKMGYYTGQDGERGSSSSTFVEQVGGQPGALGDGSAKPDQPVMEDEYVSQRRRRRLSQIVPNPRKPRIADYICSLCNEQYQHSIVENPWWAVAYQQCKKCNQMQIPRIDIMAEANAIEHDPNVQALYGEGLEDSGDEQILEDDAGGEAYQDGEEEVGQEGGGDDGDHFGNGADGLLEREEASKLLVLMCHARTCTGVHNSAKHAEICRSTKFLMLHIRDCNGVDIHGRPCRFPWCLPCKRMLQHLTQCYDPTSCSVCNPWSLPDAFAQLKSLNEGTDPAQAKSDGAPQT
jgi:hypothetical protein